MSERVSGSFWDRLTGRNTKALDKHYPQRPVNTDVTEGMVANADILNGLYYGSEIGLQHASPYAYAPVNVPISFMSIPTPIATDDVTKEAIKKLVEERSEEYPIIERTKRIMGTAWRWVRYDAQSMSLIWESIPDQSITDIQKDPSTNDITCLRTNEMFKVCVGENKIIYAQRKRTITPDKITVQWIGDKSGLPLMDSTSSNPFHHMPIPFGHDCGENEWRGHSIFCRTLRTYKTIHDVEQNRSQILSDFQPKLVHEVSDADSWLKNNGYSTDITRAINDTFLSRFFLNIFGKEKSSILALPSDATSPHERALDQYIKRLVMGDGIPEIFWGEVATGNAASTDSQRDAAVQYVDAQRKEDNAPYDRLHNDSLEVLAFIDNARYTKVTNAWDEFDMVSPLVKAQILQTVSAGIGAIVQNASGTKEDIYYFWKRFYPKLPETDIKVFTDGLTEMAKHKAFSVSDVYSQNDAGNAG
jgi:hypothetical protein